VLKRPGADPHLFQLLVPKPVEARAAHWLRALSDGFVIMDADDEFVKAPGPVVVRRLPHELGEAWPERPPSPEQFDEETIGWALDKPYWVGRCTRCKAPGGLEALPAFTWTAPEGGDHRGSPLRRTHLYEAHRQAGAKIVPFAGYEMPVQYTSVMEEHLAVRGNAGLFDVSHMGLFEFTGEDVHLFLNTIAANDVALTDVGGSQYSFLLAPDGSVVDDIWIYRLDRERYWVVVNASNNDKDWAWIEAVKEGRVMIDPQRPWVRALGAETVQMRDMRDPALRDKMRGQLALQGPKSRDILLTMVKDEPARQAILEMQRTEIIHAVVAGYDVWLARTGYTGEPMAFEIFVRPADMLGFWRAVLEAGKPFGLRPCGLAARDSLRIEAGLPLYGHELAGPLDLNPADTGFAPYVKLYKPFFVGKGAYMAHEAARQARLIRFQIDEEHAPLLNQGDVIVNRKGRVVGWVTSCSINTEGRLVGLGFVQEPNHERGARLGAYRAGSKTWETDPLVTLGFGDRIQLPEDITVIARFLNKQ
jgi:glycine hydroxymethyltransferase